MASIPNITIGAKTFSAVRRTIKAACDAVDHDLSAWLADHPYVTPDGQSAYAMVSALAVETRPEQALFYYVVTVIGPIDDTP